MDTIYYTVKYNYRSTAWGGRSVREDEVKFKSLLEMYKYIAENFTEGQIINIRQVIVQEMDVKKNYTIAKQSLSYKIEFEDTRNLIKYIESYKELVKFVENVSPGVKIKKITDPYGNDLTCAPLKRG